MKYATKTEIYQKIKKPLLERQRRARINKCLDGLKQLMVDLNGDTSILRMDKAEMLEKTIAFLQTRAKTQQMPLDGFRNGYINAVNEVSRVLSSTPGMTVEMGKSIMTHLGRSYNHLQQQHEQQQQKQQHYYSQMHQLTVDCPPSPASSGYHSETECESPPASPVAAVHKTIWRPW